MKKIEQKFQTQFGKWCQAVQQKEFQETGKKISYGYELKQTKNQRLNWNAVKDHQIRGLITDRETGRHYKFPDVGFTRYPYDSRWMQISEGYVVIKYRSEERGNSEFVMVEVDEYVYEKERSEEKSLHEDRAIEIGVLQDLKILQSN
jgi:hypothetical protein